MSTALKARLTEEAQRLGFADLKICTPDSIPHMPAALDGFLEAGYQGDMSWLSDRKEWRSDPAALWPDARSIIMLADNYAPDHDPRDQLNHGDRASISVYAQNKDYHDVLKKRLKALGRFLIEHGGGEIKVFVDTAPVAEKPLAQAAGLGWQGKHTNLVSRSLGNWFFLGALFTTLDLEKDAMEYDNCGSCTSCISACPTQAIVAPYRLDARLCISYLTIEYSGSIPLNLREKMGNRIYGCDDCLAACPWNKFAQEARNHRYAAREDLRAPHLAELVQLDDAAFRAKFSGSPIKRIKRDRFVRNVLYAIGNSGNPDFLPMLPLLCEDPNAIVAEAARWAIMRLENAANGLE